VFGMYIGRYDNKIDSKGRLSIPADFRRLLEENDPKWEPGKNAQMVIVFGDHRRNYLEVYSINDLLGVHRQIRGMDPGSKKRAALQKLFAQQVHPATFDDTGRIVLPSYLRDKVGLSDKALVVGNSQTFMIWEPEAYANDDMSNLKEEDDYDPTLDPAVYLSGDAGLM